MGFKGKSKIVTTEVFQVVIRGNITPAMLTNIPREKLVAFLIQSITIGGGLVGQVEGIDVIIGEVSPSNPPQQ